MSVQLPITATGTFLDGAIKLDHPLDLPPGTRLKVIIAAGDAATLDAADQQIVADILAQDQEVFQALAR